MSHHRFCSQVLAIFLLLWIPSISSASKDEEGAITCGSVIKIEAKENGYYLSSEQKQLGGGSGQQLVTFQKSKSTQKTLWMVRPANHGKDDHTEYPPGVSSCQMAKPIPCNTAIRLTHLNTQRNLHSHGVPSPMSRQQEVTGYGQGDGKGDGGDDWIVRCLAPRAQYWKRGEPFHLFHRDTSKFLGTSRNMEFTVETCGRNCPIMGHLEAFGRSSNDKHTIFTVEQGVHLSA